MPPLTRYLTVEQAETLLSNLAADFSSSCDLIELPHRTFEGRASHAVRLRAGAADGRPAMLFTGCLHAREWGSCEILITLATDLLRAFTDGTGLRYGNSAFTAGDIRAIMNRLDIVIFPVVNPDGRHFSLTHSAIKDDAEWRKNRNPAHSGGRPKCIGVDINRNFDFLFNFRSAFSPGSAIFAKVSADPCNFEVYQGPAPFSEAETQNVRFLFDSNPEARWYVDVHSYEGKILFAWGDDESHTADPAMNFRNAAFDGKRGIRNDVAYREFIPAVDLETSRFMVDKFLTGLRLVRRTFYGGEMGFDLYPTCGTSADYAYSRHLINPDHGKVLAFTVEWGEEFQPLWPKMQEIVADVVAGLLALMRDAASRSTTLPQGAGARGNPALIQSTFGQHGNYEVVVPLARRGIAHAFQNNDGGFFWSSPTEFAAGVGLVDAIAMIQSNFGPGNLEVVARVGSRLAHFFRDHEPPFTWNGPTFIQVGVTGNPALIQSTFGENGNFELVTPLLAGGLGHFSRDNDAPGSPWSGPTVFGTDLGVVDAVTMIQSNLGPGNLEVVARAGNRLADFFRDHEPPFAWHGPRIIVDDVSGNPVLIQSNFGKTGNFELVTPRRITPLSGGGLAHFARDNDVQDFPWSGPTPFATEFSVVDAVTMIQSRQGPGNLEVICRVGRTLAQFTRDHAEPFAWHATQAPAIGL